MGIEIYTLVFSTLTGFILRYLSNQQENTFKLLQSDRESRVEAASRGGVWIRRFIVFIMMILFVFIVAGPAIFPHIPTVVLEEHWYGNSTLEIHGILYDETTKQILLSIIGYYFGDASAKKC